MRVGFLLPSIYMYPRFSKGRIFAPGGLGLSLVNGLVEKNHKVYFYTAPGTETRAEVISGDEELLKADPFYYLFRNRSREEQDFTTTEIRKRDYEYDLTCKAYRDAASGKLDIIHSYHDFGAHYFNGLTGFPTVYTLHDPMPVAGTIEDLRFKKFANHNYISISNNQRKNYPINFVSTVYHGIDLNDFEYGEGEGGYLIHFGRILEDKGTHLAIDIAKQTDLPLKIASSFVKANLSQAYYEEKVKPQVDGVKISEVGFMERKEKSDYIKRGMAFVFPLQWDEPFGMVMIEAMACGTPVIAFNRGSASELVKDGVTGFIVDPPEQDLKIQNSESRIQNEGKWIIKKKGIDGMIEAVNRIKEIDRKKVRRHVEENFTVEKMVDDYQKVYQKFIGYA